MRVKRITTVAAAFALVLTACGGGGTTVGDGEQVVIDLHEFAFSPNEIHVKAGTTVTFVLRNTGDKTHEFMIGRNVRYTDGAPDGFEHNFFEDSPPVVVPADAVMSGEMDMGGTTDTTMGDMSTDTTMGDMSTDTTMGDMSTDTTMGDMGDMGGEAGHGFMVMRDPGQEATLTIIIPSDASGEWSIGCFQEDGAHWDDGMQGKLIIDA